MSDKVYAVYSIPKSPEYRLEKMFKTKEGAKNWIKQKKNPPTIMCIDCHQKESGEKHEIICGCHCHHVIQYCNPCTIYDIQIEEICE